MDKYKNKPKTFLITEWSRDDFQIAMNQKLSELFDEGAEIHDIKPLCGEMNTALIIYS
jgi:hypothetical protein